MKVICGNLPSKKKECVVTVGTFDGVHPGHRLVISACVNRAKSLGVRSLVITFDRHPRLVLNKHFPGYVTELNDKLNIIKSLGADYVWILKTRPGLLKLSGKKFIELVCKHFIARWFVAGEDFRLGYRGASDIRHLRQFGREHGFGVTVLKKKRRRNEILSSSLIRRLIHSGRFKKIRNILGYDYCLKGVVARGRGVGRSLGFPTANINMYEHAIPGRGVYAACAHTGGKKYPAAVNIGLTPTLVASEKIIIEAHLLGLKKNILGKKISLVFFEKIRDEKKFASRLELQKAIAADLKYIKRRYNF